MQVQKRALKLAGESPRHEFPTWIFPGIWMTAKDGILGLETKLENG